jgi:hypothetical protein
MSGSTGFLATFSDWMARIRKPITWIYCSAILFPLAFAVVAALFLAVRHQSDASGAILNGMLASFYVILMSLLAAAPRSVMPALLIWLLIAGFRPALDENKATRYLGLFLLIGIALCSHSKVYAQPFNFIWLSIAYLALVLPRLALPSLRGGLKETGE